MNLGELVGNSSLATPHIRLSQDVYSMIRGDFNALQKIDKIQATQDSIMRSLRAGVDRNRTY